MVKIFTFYLEWFSFTEICHLSLTNQFFLFLFYLSWISIEFEELWTVQKRRLLPQLCNHNPDLSKNFFPFHTVLADPSEDGAVKPNALVIFITLTK